jgi:hypothetical protein
MRGHHWIMPRYRVSDPIPTGKVIPDLSGGLGFSQLGPLDHLAHPCDAIIL